MEPKKWISMEIIEKQKNMILRYLRCTIILSQKRARKIISIGIISINNLYPKECPPHHIFHFAYNAIVKTTDRAKYL
ncbi:MAG: hypothetical protein JW800_01630 [Candidatus Omnitrophica bacterium]|nr:hypothetical protein [Candidatus Omnitrophota bacterium]